jgi:four helix bundle protein
VDPGRWRSGFCVHRSTFGREWCAGDVVKDVKFNDQIRRAAAAAPRNIAEGFRRFMPAGFANKIRIALGELGETESSLLDGEERGYFNTEDVARIRR